MRIKLLIAVLSLATAFALVALVPAVFAQTMPPAAAETPMKPRVAPAEEVASKNVSVAEKAQKCLKIEDETNDPLVTHSASSHDAAAISAVGIFGHGWSR